MNRLSITRVLATILLYLACSVRVLAADVVNTYEPANFPTDQSSLTSRIEFPDYPENILIRVFCDVRLTNSGNFESSVCWADHKDRFLFTQAVLKNFDSTTISPARVSGRNVAIWFQYTVQFEKHDGIESIRLFPHHFYGIDGTGEGYIGPQRYNDPLIPEGILNKCEGRFSIWYAMLVPAEGGKPGDVTAMNKSSNENCERYTKIMVEQGLYIPAVLDGVAAIAPYLEAWVDRFGP